MIEAHRKLIRVRDHFRRRRISARLERSARIVRQRIARQDGRNAGINRHRQNIG